MRRIVTFKLKNGNSINVIADTTSDKEAKQLAIDNSNRLIREEAFMIIKSTPIVHSETWEKGRKTQIQENSKIFNAAFYMNNITQFISIKANSVKNAYITIINKYGIQNNTFMIIYESNQCDKRKSALNESKKVIENEKEIQKICRCAINKSRKTEYAKYKDVIRSIAELLKNYSNNEYKEIDKRVIGIITAILIYFNNSSEFILDINEETKEFNELQAVEYLIGNIKNEIIRYNKWKKTRKKNI